MEIACHVLSVMVTIAPPMYPSSFMFPTNIVQPDCLTMVKPAIASSLSKIWHPLCSDLQVYRLLPI